MQADSIFAPLADTSKLGSTAEIQRAFSTSSARDWCELIRDVVAVANSGGGRIVVDALVDETEVLRRLAHYTGSAFADVHLSAVGPPNVSATAITVGPAVLPLGFAKSGVCPKPGDPTAHEVLFPAGSFYFRHGQRSEPGTTADMRAFFERLMRRVRRRWLRGIRRVLTAPIAFEAGVSPRRTPAKRKEVGTPNLQPVRIVTDPDAPALQPQDVDRLYPWRQKDLLRELNRRIGRRALNSYDIQAVRRQHRLDERPDFVFNLPGAGRRYSPAVAEWIMEQLGRDPDFFKQARAADQATLRLRRQKPR